MGLMGLMGIRVEGRRGRIILATDYADYADSGCGWVCVPFVCRWIVEVLGVVFCAARLLFGLVRVGAVGLVGWGNEF
jgi:hypothetical protein